MVQNWSETPRFLQENEREKAWPLLVSGSETRCSHLRNPALIIRKPTAPTYANQNETERIKNPAGRPPDESWFCVHRAIARRRSRIRGRNPRAAWHHEATNRSEATGSGDFIDLCEGGERMAGLGNGRGRTDLGAQDLVLHKDNAHVRLQPSKDERLRCSHWRVGWS